MAYIPDTKNLQSSIRFINSRVKDIVFRQKIYLSILFVLASVMAFIAYDLYRVGRIIEKKGITASTTQPIVPTDLSQITSPSAPEKVCEYKYVLKEYISEVDKNDAIQENIGYQNNKVGLYIYAEVEEFTKLAAFMANSNSGEWGYVLVPYNVKDRDATRWGKLFENLNEHKLIPIIQLHDGATEYERAKEQINDAADFLNTLEWPIKNRYITVFNEVNDEKFYKGKIDPDGYAKILDFSIKTFKDKNEHFFMLNGAFNASARTGAGYLDEREFLKKMNEKVPGIFKKLDGWASHPYPQPNFRGSPQALGRDSIKAYEWELNILKNDFGVDIKKLPVFITETGWPHKQGEEVNNIYLDENKVAEYYKYAFEKVWLPDKRVVAVTPFTIKYDPPFDHFSFVKRDLSLYPQFLAIQDIKKTKGKPPKVEYIKSKILECK